MSNSFISITSSASIADSNTGLSEDKQAYKMSSYYQFHAKIYDWTRWTFLFGRQQLIQLLPFNTTDNISIMEIGCGTGHNLDKIAHFYTAAQITGIDVSEDMLSIARKKTSNNTRIQLIKALYDKNTLNTEGGSIPQIALFSYCLTMVNPNWEKLILQAKSDLAQGGYIAVVDFHSSPVLLFKRWMAKNHVKMEGHLLPFLKEHFDTITEIIKPAYGGLWYYTLYIGKKREVNINL